MKCALVWEGHRVAREVNLMRYRPRSGSHMVAYGISYDVVQCETRAMTALLCPGSV